MSHEQLTGISNRSFLQELMAHDDEPPIEALRSEMMAKIDPWHKAPKEHMDRLHGYDKTLELIRWKPDGSWNLYKVKLYGTTPSEDLLIFQLSCVDNKKNPIELTSAFIDKAIAHWAKSTRQGTLGPDEVKREFMRQSALARWNREVRNQRRIQDWAKEVVKWTMVLAWRLRRTSHQALGRREKKRSGWKRILETKGGILLDHNGEAVKPVIERPQLVY